jgi:hypothetical protein
MEMDPNPPSFNIQYQQPNVDIGSGYAAGITQAGKSIGDAISGIGDLIQRNRNADDVISAMSQGETAGYGKPGASWQRANGRGEPKRNVLATGSTATTTASATAAAEPATESSAAASSARGANSKKVR